MLIFQVRWRSWRCQGNHAAQVLCRDWMARCLWEEGQFLTCSHFNVSPSFLAWCCYWNDLVPPGINKVTSLERPPSKKYVDCHQTNNCYQPDWWHWWWLICLCLFPSNSWSHRLSPKLPRRRTHDILTKSSQHRPSLLRHPDKVAPYYTHSQTLTYCILK